MKKQASFMVIGGANIDMTGKALSSSSVIAQSHLGQITSSFGGVARNISETLGRLDQKTQFLSAFGDDAQSQKMIDELSSLSVDCQHSLFASDAKADSYMAIYDEAGNLIAAINDMPLIDLIDADFIKQHQKVISQADRVVIDANLSPDAIEAICHTLTDAQLAADAVSLRKASKLKPYLSQLHLLKVTTEEAAQLIEAGDRLTNDQILDKLHDAGVDIILLSAGPEGFTLSSSTDRLSRKPKTDMDIVTSSGAGDGLFAGVLYGLSQNYDLEMIANIAENTATSALSSSKAVNPSLTIEMVDPNFEQENEEPLEDIR